MADFARGELLRDLRKSRHLSQDEAAHEIGVTERTLRAWERGGKIKWPNAKKAGAFYNVDPESLVQRDQRPAALVAESEERDQLDRIEGRLEALLAQLSTRDDALDLLARALGVDLPTPDPTPEEMPSAEDGEDHQEPGAGDGGA